MEDKSPLISGIRREVHNQKRNYAILIVGKTQTRKSTMGVWLAHALTDTFDMDEHMGVIKPTNFLTVLQKVPKKRGEVRLLDEFGVGMDHRQWYKFTNQGIVHTLETHGFRGMIVIVTVPFQDLVDKDALKFFDMRITTVRKDDKQKYVKIKVEELEYNEDVKRQYRRFPRGRWADGTIKRLDSFIVPYPPKDVIDRYMTISQPIKHQNMVELTQEAKKMEVTAAQQRFNAENYITRVLEKPEEYVTEWHGRKMVSQSLVMNKFPGIGRHRANQIKVGAEIALKKKGAL